MKISLLSAACFIFLSCACFAQDIIVTHDSKRINAKVTEVNEDNIRYKNFDNLDGPVYTLLKSNISTIVYQNGQVETFTQENSRPAEATQPVPAQRQRAQTPEPTRIVSSGNILADMQTYSPALYAQYRAGKKTNLTGWILVGSGAVSNFFGIGFYIANEEDVVMRKTGIALIAVGSACFATSIPMFIIGGSKKSSAIRNFNRQYYSTQPASHFQLNVYPNRIGVAYTF